MKYALTHSLAHFSLHCCGGQGLGVSLRCRIYNASDDERRAKCPETRSVSHPSPGESRTTADDGWNECTKLEIVQLQREGRNPQNAGSAQLGGTRHVEVTLFVGIFSFLSRSPNLVMAAEVKPDLLRPPDHPTDISAFTRSPFVPTRLISAARSLMSGR